MISEEEILFLLLQFGEKESDFGTRENYEMENLTRPYMGPMAA